MAMYLRQAPRAQVGGVRSVREEILLRKRLEIEAAEASISRTANYRINPAEIQGRTRAQVASALARKRAEIAAADASIARTGRSQVSTADVQRRTAAQQAAQLARKRAEIAAADASIARRPFAEPPRPFTAKPLPRPAPPVPVTPAPFTAQPLPRPAPPVPTPQTAIVPKPSNAAAAQAAIGAAQSAGRGAAGLVGALNSPAGLAGGLGALGQLGYDAGNGLLDQAFPALAPFRPGLQGAATLAGANPFGFPALANHPYNPLNPFGQLWGWAPWNDPKSPNSLSPGPQTTEPNISPEGFWPVSDPGGPIWFRVAIPNTPVNYFNAFGQEQAVPAPRAQYLSGWLYGLPLGWQITDGTSPATGVKTKTYQFKYGNNGTLLIYSGGTFPIEKAPGLVNSLYHQDFSPEYYPEAGDSQLTRRPVPVDLSGAAVPAALLPPGSPPLYEPTGRPEFPPSPTPAPMPPSLQGSGVLSGGMNAPSGGAGYRPPLGSPAPIPSHRPNPVPSAPAGTSPPATFPAVPPTGSPTSGGGSPVGGVGSPAGGVGSLAGGSGIGGSQSLPIPETFPAGLADGRLPSPSPKNGMTPVPDNWSPLTPAALPASKPAPQTRPFAEPELQPLSLPPASSLSQLSQQISQLAEDVEDKTRKGCRYEEDDLIAASITRFTGLAPITEQPQFSTTPVQVHEKLKDYIEIQSQVLAKIESQVDGTRSRIKRVLDRLQIIRILNLMGAIASIHNAAMLSRNLGQTLGDATSGVINAIGRVTGVMSAEESIDVNQIIGETFENLMKSTLGEDNWNGTKKTWNKANRILSSASQIIWSIRSINDSRREILEWIGENTGKIGNALKRFGVVGEKAYGWMPERFNTQTAWERKFTRFREGLDNLDDAASSIESVSGEVLNITEEVNQITQQRQEFETLLSTAETKVRPENAPVKTATDLAKSISLGQETTPTDMEPNPNATP